MSKLHILCFFDNDRGRDVEIVLPVLSYVKLKHDIEVDYAFIFDIHQIYLQKPDIVVVPNTIGSLWYYYIAKYAHENGIPVFALVSEGNFRTDGSFDIWGFNRSKKFYQEYVCLWSKRTHDYMCRLYPETTHKFKFTGATGFDRYKIFNFEKKESFLEKNGLQQYKKVIGYAGWAFGKLYNKQGLEELIFWLKGDESKLKWVEEQMLSVERILKGAIESNPDTLFILKKHPSEANSSITYAYKNEMNGLTGYKNVLYVSNEIDIHDLISISDIWLAFESTTSLESWVMDNNKPTIYINPDPYFNRDELYKGCYIVTNFDELQRCIDEFYTTGRIEKLLDTSLIQSREVISESIIGYSDGLNHVRAGELLEKIINTHSFSNKKVKLNYKYLFWHVSMIFGQFIYIKALFLKLPKFKKTTWIFDNWKLPNIKNREKEYLNTLPDFYKKTTLTDKPSDIFYLNSTINNH